MSRIIGATIYIKISRGFEIAACLVTIVGMIFTKNPIDWVSTLIFFVLCAASTALMYVDDKLYLYVVEDIDDSEEDN